MAASGSGRQRVAVGGSEWQWEAASGSEWQWEAGPMTPGNSNCTELWSGNRHQFVEYSVYECAALKAIRKSMLSRRGQDKMRWQQ